jgi:hypothetical protein
VSLHENDMVAERHWAQASMAVKHAYGLPLAPGASIPAPDPRSEAMRTQQKLGTPDQGRHNFVVLEVKIEAIDWLQISSTGQIRAILRAEHGWKAEPLAP